jgi:hypothetical protein
MLKGSKRFRSMLTLISCSIAFVSILCFFFTFWAELSIQDVNRKAPNDVYDMIFTTRPPIGVTDIRATGRIDWKLAWAWMRFKADEHTMRMLASGQTPVSISEERVDLAKHWSVQDTYDAIDQRRIGWSDVYRIAHPDSYEIWSRTSDQTSTWFGLMVFDHSKHEVFVVAQGD